MKRRDLIALIFALVLLVGAGYLVLNQGHHPAAAAKASAQAEVVPVISPQLDPDGTMTKMVTTYKVRDYKQPINVASGLGNSAPFVQ